MTLKQIFLGAVAGLATAASAQAADLPMTKGEAVEYVKVCSTFGPGFFYIPGSDTCLKIGGEIRADYRAFGHSGDISSFTRNDNRTAFATQARIWFDARTQTDYGLLRSYFQINADSRTATTSGTGTTNNFSIDKAFIQFGGLTAGYAHSFFGFYDNEYGDTIWAAYYAESSTVNLLAYTAQFGGGFSATLSIEDGRDHRETSFSSIQGGQQVPDVVGQLRWDQDWGSLAVQAAAHQFRTADDLTDADGNALSNGNKWGYAVGATGLVKLPFIDGGHFIVEGQYANGATHYLGAGNTQYGAQDYYYNANDRFNAGKGWSIVAEFGGNITPVLNANLVGSYINTTYDNYVENGINFGVEEFSIAGNLAYTIVKGLTISGEVSYTREKLKNLADTSAETTTFSDQKENIWQAGIRIKRVF